MVVGYILRFSLFDLPLGSILLLLVLLVLVPFLLQHILRRKFVFFLLLLVSRFGQYTRYGSGWACDGRFRFLALRYQRLQLHSFNFCSKASKQIAARNDGNLCMKSSTLLRSLKGWWLCPVRWCFCTFNTCTRSTPNCSPFQSARRRNGVQSAHAPELSLPCYRSNSAYAHFDVE